MTKKTRAKARRALLTLSLVLVMMMVAVGGTIAWLTDTSDTVTNTFTASEVSVTLTETTGTEYKMVPGNTLEKDPVVKLDTGSEDAWVFAKIEKSTDPAFDSYLEYTINAGWTKLEEEGNVIWYGYNTALKATDTAVSVLKDDEVKVKTTVTEDMMTAIATKKPTLTLTAYAIQSANINDINAAWTHFGEQNSDLV